jgi:hypothetical protein
MLAMVLVVGALLAGLVAPANASQEDQIAAPPGSTSGPSSSTGSTGFASATTATSTSACVT